MKSSNSASLRYWIVGIQYLHLVESVAKQVTETGNRFVVISENEIAAEKFDNETKWADHALVIPLLFDFYHGIEVLLKGFLIANGASVKKTHRLSELLSRFKSIFPDSTLSSLLTPYIDMGQLKGPLEDFCKESNITIDNYYQSLKYPESTDGKVYDHIPLEYRGGAGVTFFKNLAEDIHEIRLEAVRLGRMIDKHA